jgi:O-glycosyl hydrolase
MTDFFTVRVPKNYTKEFYDNFVVARYENNDRVVFDSSYEKQFNRSQRFKIQFSDIAEVRQKTAKISQVITKSGTQLTVNSKNGVRLFKFLNTDSKDPKEW